MSSPVESRVLQEVAAAPVIREPFEHCVIDEVFPQEFFREIQANWPELEQFLPLEESGRLRSKGRQKGKRNVVFLTDEGLERLDAGRRRFWAERMRSWLCTPQFQDAVIGKFRDVLGPRLGADTEIVADGLIVSDRTEYSIGPHTDHPRRLVSMLFYLPPDASLRQFGTALYKPKAEGFTCAGGPHYSFDNFTRVKTFDFVPNRLVFFPKSDRCFHAVEPVTVPDAERRLLIFDFQARRWEDARPSAASWSRSNPSPRYRELMRQYREMHQQGERFLAIAAEDTFPGFSLKPHLQTVRDLAEATGALSILDYGSGKGRLYRPQRIEVPGEPGRWESVADYWNVDNVACYDPCYAPFSTLPEGRFDGVVSTDVLEHCPEEDIPWILEEIFSYASKFVFLTVAGYEARKRLPNGENAHCTLRPLEWWQSLVGAAASRHPGLRWKARYYADARTPREFGSA